MQTIVRPSQPHFEIAASQAWWEVAGSYVIEGIRLILFGADHLLFVLGLLLIVANGWMLVNSITAFTVAHGITLIVATLGYAEAPALPLNAAIALSGRRLAASALGTNCRTRRRKLDCREWPAHAGLDRSSQSVARKQTQNRQCVQGLRCTGRQLGRRHPTLRSRIHRCR
jgi:HupE / UreJ protein